jgi:hypothetical protein
MMLQKKPDTLTRGKHAHYVHWWFLLTGCSYCYRGKDNSNLIFCSSKLVEDKKRPRWLYISFFWACRNICYAYFDGCLKRRRYNERQYKKGIYISIKRPWNLLSHLCPVLFSNSSTQNVQSSIGVLVHFMIYIHVKQLKNNENL